MGYLVYCPTCNGKMSNNAKCCPHCGETHFYKREHNSQKIQCNTCNGSGELTSYKDSVDVRVVGNEIIGIEARVLRWETEMDGRGEVCDIPIVAEHPNVSEIISHIKNHQCKIKGYEARYRGKPVTAIRTTDYGRIGKWCGYGNAKLLYNKEIRKCHNCNGIGYFTDNSDYHLRDMRKRVEQPTSMNDDDEFDRLLDDFLRENFG